MRASILLRNRCVPSHDLTSIYLHLRPVGCVCVVAPDRLPFMVEGWGLLAARIAAERSRRWHSRAAFAKAAGVSVRVIDDLERGLRGNYSDATLAAVEAALGWEFGSALRVVQGGRPRREVDPYFGAARGGVAVVVYGCSGDVGSPRRVCARRPAGAVGLGSPTWR